MTTAATTFAFGAKIECNYQSSGKWYPGTIMGIRDDGKFDILYDDGDGESEVTTDRIKPRGEESTEIPATAAQVATPGPAAASAAAKKSEWEVGATVQVRKGKDWKAGQIAEIDDELGSVVVEYSNGEKEKGVPLQSIRKFQADRSDLQKKKKKSKKGSTGKKMNECVEVLSKFNEAELEAALKMLQALDSIRAEPNQGS